MLSTNPRTPGQLSASSTTALSPLALCTQCWGTKLLSIFFPIFLGWAALACQGESFIVSASFAQSSSFSSRFPSFSIRNQLEAEMVSFKHEQLMKVQLANEAYTLPPSLLKHIFEGKLVNKQLEEHPAELEAAFFKELLPELPEADELEFFLVLGELAMKSFKETSFNQLPQQKVKGTSNANLGNWQASSSFAKAVSFWAWTACRAPDSRACSRSSLRHKLPLQGPELCSEAQSFEAWSHHQLGLPRRRLSALLLGKAACFLASADFQQLGHQAWRHHCQACSF